MSSPVRQAPVSVLSPVLRRSFTVASPPPARITLDAAVNAVVDCRDMAINACVGTADQEVQATVGFRDAFTDYDPPAEIAPVAELLETVLCESPSAMFVVFPSALSHPWSHLKTSLWMDHWLMNLPLSWLSRH